MKVFIFIVFTIFYVESTPTKDTSPNLSETLNLKDAICTYLEDDKTTACSLCDSYCPNSGSKDSSRDTFSNLPGMINLENTIYTHVEDDSTTASSLCDSYCPNSGSKDSSRVSCVDNSQCPSDTACLIGYCEDPCPFFDCTDTTECTTFNHSATCISAHGCNMHEDCPSNKTCLNKRCEDLCASYKCGGDLSCKIVDHKISCVHKRRYHPETSKKLNFTQAMDFCDRRGMRLATFDTEEEYYQLVNLLKEIKKENHLDADSSPYYYGFFIGGSDQIGGTWMWMSLGKPLTYTKWARNQPDHKNDNKQYCLELQPAYNYEMNDGDCPRPSYFVCEDVTMA